MMLRLGGVLLVRNRKKQIVKSLDVSYGDLANVSYLVPVVEPFCEEPGPCCLCGGHATIGTVCSKHPWFCLRCYSVSAGIVGCEIRVVNIN